MKRICLFVLSVLLFVPMIARAQVQTGTPPFGTFGGGPDVINLANLNSHITVPVYSKAGRGLPFSFYLTQDSSVWFPVTASGSTSWQPVKGWGWNQSEANVGSVVVSSSGSTTIIGCGKLQSIIETTVNGFTYNDGFHTSHAFPMTTTTTDNQCTRTITSTSAQATASDGSGYTLSATGGTVTKLVGANGNLINPATGAGSVQDRNGNEISLNGSGVITDTLGQTALTIAGSGTPSSPMTFTYPAPSGANAVYTEKFSSYTVQTNFGCSGISEFGPTSENLVSEIDLPDIATVPSDKYVITYEATPGHAGNVTGRIAQITLPTGGTISYSYSGGSNGVTCADGSTATLTRTTPDGTWTYAHSESGTAWTTTATDPQGNETVYNFQGIYQTERKVYQGSTTLLQDEVTCYNSVTGNCNNEAITLPIKERIVTDTLGNEQCKHVYSYNSFGLLTEQDDYDYGNGAPGPLIRKQLITYASLGNNILNQPSEIQVEDGSNNVVAQTNTNYDEVSVVATSGTPQHIAISGARGNPTSVVYTVAGTTTLKKSFTYFDTGNVQTATDVNGAQTTYTYGACGNSFPTTVSEPLSLSQSIAWNCTGGVETSATDENSQTVSTAYTDAYFWRPATSTDQESNVTNFNYQPNASFCCPPLVASSMTFNNGNSLVQRSQYKDSMGRTYTDQHLEAPGSTLMDTVSYVYDSEGRVASASGPCAVSWTLTCSGPTTTQTYDALNRPLVTTDGGGGTLTLSYTGNDTLQTVGPAPTGENTKRRQSEYNSIGQLTSVCEITAGTTSAPAGTCAQNTSATGYWTKYTYDVLGDLLTVTQNAQSSTTQSRSYTYDELGRMLSETNPETGAINYVYDTDATCGTSKGDLVKRTDAAGNVTCYAYDALHRPTSIAYPSGPNSANTPGKFLVYDAATVNSVAMANAKARLAEAYTCTSPCSLKITDEGFSYTVRGEIGDVYESTPHSGGYYHVNETYWANGGVQTISSLTGLPTLTYAPDGEGRTKAVSASSGQNPLTSTTYNVASEVTALTLGSGDSDAFTFDPNTFRMTQYKYTIGATPQSLVGNLTWNANGSLGKLAITDPFNATNTQTCNYTHDDLARVASGNCGSVWSQTFSYDAFGNLTKAGSNSFNPGYNTATNRMSTGATYDSNGDVLTDSLHSYAWDVETRPTTIDTVTATYDALGRMVEQTKAGTSTEIVYDARGNKLGFMNGSSLVKAYVSLPAGDIAAYAASGLANYHHMDWLGNFRLQSTTSRTVGLDTAYAPFGETYATTGSGSGVSAFAELTQDTTTNLYDAQNREYEITGRWPSPDPAGIAAANPANPQSWNRYAYVMNNPLAATDSTGMGQNNINQCPAGMCGSLGQEIMGCDEFDFLDSTSYCSQTILPMLNGTYSPFQYQYTGLASDGQPVTFDTWDQYASWLNGIAAGAQDPCVYMNDSATGVQDIDFNSDFIACKNSPGGGGNWVPAGMGFHVDPDSGTVVVTPPGGLLPPSSSHSAFLACMYQQDVENEDVYGVALTATAVPLTRGNIVAANYSLIFVTMPMVWGQLLRSNLGCSAEAGY